MSINIVLWLVLTALLILIGAVFLWATQSEKDRDELHGRIEDLEDEVDLLKAKYEDRFDAVMEAVRRDFEGWGKNFKIHKDEIDILTSRQRSLEKSIIKSERTINLNITDLQSKAAFIKRPKRVSQ